MTDRFATLRHGLVGAWCPSLGGDGSLLRDRGPRCVHLTNRAPFVARQGGTALSIGGADDAIVASTTALAPAMNSATAATLSMWFWKPAANGQASGGFTGDSASGNRFAAAWYIDGNIYCAAESSGAQSGVYVAWNFSGWIHLAMRYDGSLAAASRLRVYVNGVQRSGIGYGTVPATLSSSLGTFSLGRDTISRLSTEGVVRSTVAAHDDYRVYRRALTASEILLLSSQRGIGLVPTRHRRARLASATNTVWLNVGGVWKQATPKINVGGVWKTATPQIRVGGAWKG